MFDKYSLLEYWVYKSKLLLEISLFDDSYFRCNVINWVNK